LPNIDPEIELGPLAGLVGAWAGDSGHDLAPEPEGTEDNAYYERIEFDLTRRVSNAEEQKLAVVQYRQLVQRATNDKILHDQSGYWAWDAASKTLMHVFSIPRGVTVIAGGKVAEGSSGELIFDVSAKVGDKDWSISEAPFMQKKARTIGFSQQLILTKDTEDQDSLSYSQMSLLDIYGREFEHTDENTLRRLTD